MKTDFFLAVIRNGVHLGIVSSCSFCFLTAQDAKQGGASPEPISAGHFSGVVVPNIDYAKQGYSMLLHLNNNGAYGRISYRNPGSVTPYTDSLGLEYPVGDRIEHMWGGGLWVGGVVDQGGGQFLKSVSTTYESEFNRTPEFYPGSSPADAIWRVN